MNRRGAKPVPSEPRIRFTRPPPLPQQSKGYSVLCLDRGPAAAKKSWQSVIQDYRLWCFNKSPDRYQFGHEDRKCSMLPNEGHFLIYITYQGRWLCAVINGPTGYLDGYITRSTGKDVRARQHQTRGNKSKPQFIDNDGKLPWDGCYTTSGKRKAGYDALIKSFKNMYISVESLHEAVDRDKIIEAGETFILHLPECGRSNTLSCFIGANFIKGCEMDEDLVDDAKDWSKKSAKVSKRILDITQPLDEASTKSRKASKKISDITPSKLRTERTRKMPDQHLIDEEVWGPEVFEELDIIEDLRLLYRPKPIRSKFYLKDMPVHLTENGPVNNKLVKHMKDAARLHHPDLKFLRDGFKKFRRAEKKEEAEKSPHEENSSDYIVKAVEECSVAAMDTDYIVKALDKSSIAAMDSQEYNAGLRNMGNTCYMNSTLQCLLSVPELQSSILSYTDTMKDNVVDPVSHDLTLAIRDTFVQLQQSVQPVEPVKLLKALRRKNPMFDEKRDNVHRQQDAEDCLHELVGVLSHTLSPASKPGADLMKELFGINLVKRVKNMDSDEAATEIESVFSLRCGISASVHNITDALTNSLKSVVEGQNATCTEPRLNEFPRYLTIQFDRSYWDKQQQKQVKLEHGVEYPAELDIRQFCSEDMKCELQAPQQFSSNVAGESSDSNQANDLEPIKALTGIYDLMAVVAHDGDGLDSGHYTSWVKQDDGKWVEFSDECPSIRSEKEVLELWDGGKRGEMPYIFMYRGRLA